MASPRYVILFLVVTLLLHLSVGDMMKISGETQNDQKKENNQVTSSHRRASWGWFNPIFALDHYWNNATLSGPSYKIAVDDDKIELTYDVKGYDKDNLIVDIKSGVLSISGEKRSEDSGKLSISSFHHTFSVNPKVQHDDVSAQLSLDNELVVTVLKKWEGTEPHVSHIPILTLGQRVVE